MLRGCIVPCALLRLASLDPASAESLCTDFVFGPETDTGPYKHPSSITELENGDLYLAYYGGEGEYAESTKVFGSRRKAGEDSWARPEVIASNPFQSLGNPVVWQAPDGLVWLFYVTRFGETWSTSRIAAKISTDGAESWSDSVLLTLEEGFMVRSHPVVLRSGDYLLPVYHETGHDTERTGADTTSRFLRWVPEEKRWEHLGIIRSKKGNLQPAVVELDDGRLLAFCRRAGDYEPTTKGWIVRAESANGGRTWSEGTDSEFPNPNASVECKRLQSGNLLLVFNDSMSERTPLTAALSTDEGKTFRHRKNIAEGPGSFAYPTAIQTRDGTIHVTFTSDERTVIRHAVFDEKWLLDPAG